MMGNRRALLALALIASATGTPAHASTLRDRARGLCAKILTFRQPVRLLIHRRIENELHSRKPRHSNLKEAIVATAVNALSLHYVGIAVRAPRIRLLESADVPPEVLALVKEYGFEEAYPILKTRYANRARFDLAWSAAELSWATVFVGLIAYLIVQERDRIVAIVSFATASREEIEEYDRRHFDPEAIRREQFEAWKRGFHDLEGRWPDPTTHPEDREEWDRVWNRLRDTPDHELRRR